MEDLEAIQMLAKAVAIHPGADLEEVNRCILEIQAVCEKYREADRNVALEIWLQLYNRAKE